jgi:aspartate racemase
MKTIGLIGGISWLSSADYYRIINEQINQRLGDVQAGRIILYSVNYGDIKKWTQQDDWASISHYICDVAQKVEAAGADCLLLGANTMHRVAGIIQAAVGIPLIHVAEVTAQAVNKRSIRKVALLGTKFTMELDFYPQTLLKHGITTIIPGDADRDYIHATIYNELGKGNFAPEIKARYLQIIRELVQRGAEGVILGCTEIPLLIKQADSPIPVFDTTLIHASAAVEFALQSGVDSR